MNGELVRIERIQKGLSQARFSELCNIPQPLLSAFELGKVKLSDVHLDLISAALTNSKAMDALLNRKKRYVSRAPSTFIGVDRSVQAQPSQGNAQYLDCLQDLHLRASATRAHRPAALSLFSGAGGLSLGIASAGFEVKGFVEKDPMLRAIYSTNFPKADDIGQDICALSEDQIRKWKLRNGPIELMAGGPPCQGFSLAGKRRVDDQRNQLFEHYLRFMRIIEPRIAILENVRLLTSMKDGKGRFVVNSILDGFAQLGYRVQAFEINAKNFGVPQHRERVVFIAIHQDLQIQPSFPMPTHGMSHNLFSSLPPHRTFADACSDLEYIESAGTSSDELHRAVAHPDHVIKWLWDVPQGRSAHENLSAADRPPSGYNTTYKRQIWTEPGATVQTTFGMISGCRNVHPIATRSLTIREAARLQSFPDSFKFKGSLTSIRTGIGNAVPPLLADAIGSYLIQLFN